LGSVWAYLPLSQGQIHNHQSKFKLKKSRVRFIARKTRILEIQKSSVDTVQVYGRVDRTRDLLTMNITERLVVYGSSAFAGFNIRGRPRISAVIGTDLLEAGNYLSAEQ